MLRLLSRRLASTLASLALGLTLAAPAHAQDAQDSVQNFEFGPRVLTVEAGSTVTWSIDELVFHTVTTDDGSFASNLIGPGQTFSVRFDAPGTYPYYCKPHGQPGGLGM